MRSIIPRPFLLALTLVLVVGAIALIEWRLDAAETDKVQATSSHTSGENNKPDTADRVREPRRTGEMSEGQHHQVSGSSAESGERRMKDTENTKDRVEQKESRYQRAGEIVNPTGFINTDGVSLKEARGEKVVLLDFWTYSCYNCQNTQPYINRWQEKYADEGLLIVGVHSPEFGFEKEYANVEQAVREAGIEYPVVLDNNYATWNAYDQRYWPAWYLIDADGFIRYTHFGEGAYEETDAKIRELLAERDRISN